MQVIQRVFSENEGQIHCFCYKNAPYAKSAGILMTMNYLNVFPFQNISHQQTRRTKCLIKDN